MPVQWIALIPVILKLTEAGRDAFASWFASTPNPTPEQAAEQLRILNASDDAAEAAVERFKKDL